MTDRRSLSRRKLLWAMTTVGAAASAGSGTAALLSDSESLGESTVTAGVVDLETEPSWGNDDSLGTISNGESGSRTVEITLADNPSYLWFRTACKQCLPVEEALYVKYGVDTDGDGDVDLSITDGYITLAEARERFGTGEFVDTIQPSETWTLIAEWELREPVESTDLSLSFDFYATQTRHVSDPDSVTLPWSCRGCGDTSTGEQESVISWVAFCGDATFDTSFTPEREGTHTLLLDTDAYTIPTEVETIAIKYAQTIEVFSRSDGWSSRLTVGQGDGQILPHTGGNNYAGTDRNSSNFCDGAAGCKFEFDDGVWECTDGDGQGTGGNSSTNGTNRIDGTVPSNRAPRDELGGER